MKPIVLFDMDGTLSEPRETMIEGILDHLIELSLEADLGIVTGSGLPYILQQCGELIESINKLNSSMTLFPCNGTQAYTISKDKKTKCAFSENMRRFLGTQFVEILDFILQKQSDFVKGRPEINLTGTFIQYRASMLNWCPVGRDAEMPDRKLFIDFDNKKNVRKDLIDQLKKERALKEWNVDFALGGSTSIDIYPTGWDKTFCLSHISADERDVYFIGDKCQDGGNDKAIYDAITASNKGGAYETTSPQHTIQIIKSIQKIIRERR